MLPRERVPLPARVRFREALLSEIESSSVRCGVIGLGFIGSVLMNALNRVGVPARGYDRSPAAVERYSAHHAALPVSAQGVCVWGGNVEILDDCNIIFVAVRNSIDGAGLDDEPLRSAARIIGAHPVRPCLVILESTVAPGTTRRFAEEIGALNDDGMFVAHAPERLSAGHDPTTLRAIPHLVAGVDADSTQLASAILAKICDTVVAVSAPEVSETSKLLENAFLSVNIALTTEVTRLCASLGIRAQEVCQAAATKPHGFMAFHPGAGLGGHCLPNDLLLFAEAARLRGWEPELLSGAITVNNRAPQLVVDRVEASLRGFGISLAGAQVLLVGVGFKTGWPDTTRSPAIDVVRGLRERGAGVSYVDHLNPGFAVDGVPVEQVGPEAVSDRRFAAAILLSGERLVPEESLLRSCRFLLDAGGSRGNRSGVHGIETL
jgi:UDP-N-acetyl-D-glucosamine dehydrogenase